MALTAYQTQFKRRMKRAIKLVLEDHLAQSMPGEEVVIFNQMPDANGGQPLPANPLFEEVVTGTPIIAPLQTAKASPPQKAVVPDFALTPETTIRESAA